MNVDKASKKTPGERLLKTLRIAGRLFLSAAFISGYSA